MLFEFRNPIGAYDRRHLYLGRFGHLHGDGFGSLSEFNVL